MCATCGCVADDAPIDASALGDHSHDHSHDHRHDHSHDHPHDHSHDGQTLRELTLQTAILAKNDRIAERVRRHFRQQNVLALNLVSSPGAGKTTLLERMIGDLRNERTILVVEGDQATSADADRIERAGARAVQINTGTGCHLDAAMVEGAVRALEPTQDALVLIENVGNLVCPALFDLGEHAKVVVASVTEGEDKPLKYPHMFRASSLVLLNKIDLLPHLSFDVARFVANAKLVHPHLEVLAVSALTGAGLEAWYAWLRSRDAGA